MKKLLLLIYLLFTSLNYSQNADNFTFVEDTWLNHIVRHTDGSYLVLGQPDDAIIDFGFGKIMRFDNQFNQMGTTINFTNENDDNCCSSKPQYGHFINNTEFAVYGQVQVSGAGGGRVTYSLSKYDNTGDTPLIDKRLVNCEGVSLIQGQTEHYGLFTMTETNGYYNDGTGDFSFAFDTSIGNNQVVLLAYDDNLNEQWYIRFNANSETTNGLSGRDLFQASNGDIIMELFTFGTLELNGNSYGQEFTSNYFFVRVDPNTQQVIAPILVRDGQDNKKMREDPFNSGTHYLIDELDIYKLDDQWNIITQGKVFGEDFFFEEDQLMCTTTFKRFTNNTIDIYGNSVMYLDKDLNPKFEQRIFGNCIGERSNDFLFLDVPHASVSYTSSPQTLELIQTYGTEHDDDPNYVAEIDGTSLPEFNGGYHLVKYDFNIEPLQASEYIQAQVVSPATDVFNYVSKNDDGTLRTSDSHVSYLIFPSGFDFTQYPLNSLIPTDWFTIPTGWDLVFSPRFRFDTNTNQYYFEVKSSEVNTSGNLNLNSNKITYLKVYLTDEQLVLSTEDRVLDKRIAIYPNPTHDYLTIISNTQVREVILHNVHGQEIICNYENGRLDMSHLSAGMYILNIIDDRNRVVRYKIIKE